MWRPWVAMLGVATIVACGPSEAVAPGTAPGPIDRAAVTQTIAALVPVVSSDDRETATPGPVADGLISPDNLAYLGAFRLPADPEGMGWEWGGGALTYNPAGDPGGGSDSYPGSLFATGHNWYQRIGELSIPAPVLAQTIADLPVAQTLQPLTDVYGGLYPEMEQPRVALAYVPPGSGQPEAKLAFARSPHLDEGATGASHGWCGTDLATPRPAGLWRIGGLWNYVTTDYIFEMDPAWSAVHTPGYRLITGRYRDGGQGAMGPSLYAYDPLRDGSLPSAGTTLDVMTLLQYDRMDEENPVAINDYHHSDDWAGAVWLTAGDRAALLFAGTKGQGACWYGCPDGTDTPPWPADCYDRGWWSDSFVGQFLFYDPADLAAVVAGELAPSAPQPYATLSVDDVLFHVTHEMQKDHLGAAAFDRVRGLLYVLELLADEDRPLVHVWSVM